MIAEALTAGERLTLAGAFVWDQPIAAPSAADGLFDSVAGRQKG